MSPIPQARKNLLKCRCFCLAFFIYHNHHACSFWSQSLRYRQGWVGIFTRSISHSKRSCCLFCWQFLFSLRIYWVQAILWSLLTVWTVRSHVAFYKGFFCLISNKFTSFIEIHGCKHLGMTCSANVPHFWLLWPRFAFGHIYFPSPSFLTLNPGFEMCIIELACRQYLLMHASISKKKKKNLRVLPL